MNEINASPQHSVQYESVVQYSFSFYSGILHSGIGFQKLKFYEVYIKIIKPSVICLLNSMYVFII